jgi:hypothetical protein
MVLWTVNSAALQFIVAGEEVRFYQEERPSLTRLCSACVWNGSFFSLSSWALVPTFGQHELDMSLYSAATISFHFRCRISNVCRGFVAVQSEVFSDGGDSSSNIASLATATSDHSNIWPLRSRQLEYMLMVSATPETRGAAVYRRRFPHPRKPT